MVIMCKSSLDLHFSVGLKPLMKAQILMPPLDLTLAINREVKLSLAFMQTHYLQTLESATIKLHHQSLTVAQPAFANQCIQHIAIPLWHNCFWCIYFIL